MERPARPASSWRIPSPGETIEGRMRVLDRLGRGSHGEVHRGWDLAHHRFVALKIARDPDPCVARDALLREMLPLRAVAHPHLVRLERAHFGRRSGFIALELLDPTPLSARVAAGALPAWAAVRVVAGLADALEAMHAAGWAHRDVKAENVLFGPRDRPVLADLGLACSRGLLDDDLRMAPGTPSYMAPEVVRGAVDCFDGWRAVDQYALGVTAYYALTGAMPFQERGIYAQMFAHLALEPTPPSARRPALAPLDGVILRALAKDPGARFDGVGAFGAALRRAARGA
jgi:serine/threonine-protein kinase